MKPKDPALLIQAEDQPGVLSQLTRVIAAHQANISYIDVVGRLREQASVYLELQDVSDLDLLIREIQALPVVRSIEQPEPFLKIYGKRVIIIGGGAQVGQVALGAISEADRHEIYGARESLFDTIPLVGEAELGGAAVRRGGVATPSKSPRDGRCADGGKTSHELSRASRRGELS